MPRRRHLLYVGLVATGLASCRSSEHCAENAPAPPAALASQLTADQLFDGRLTHARFAGQRTAENGTTASAEPEQSVARATTTDPRAVQPDAPLIEASPVAFDSEDELRPVGYIAPPLPAAAVDGPDTPITTPAPLVLEGDALPVGLTLADFEQMALVNNPSLQVAGYGIGERRGVHTQVGLKANPQVGYSGQEIGSDGEAGQQGVYLSQTIVRGRKLELNRAIACWDTQEANWIAETQRFRVLNDVRTAYYDTLGAQRRIAIAEQLVAVAEKGVETSQALVDAQQAARPDVLQAEVQLSEVGIILRNAEIEYDSAWNRLVSLAGNPHLARTPIAGQLLEDLPAVEWDYAYDTLVSLSPELQRADVRIQRARVLITRQTAQPTPNLLPQLGVANDFGGNQVLTSVQIGIPLPICNRNQGNVHAAIAEYHRAERDAERIRLSLRNRLAVTVRDFSQARQQAERYRDEIVPRSRESFELIEAGYEQGEFDFLRVLTARRNFFETQLNAVQSLIALNRAHVTLEGLLLTGGLDPVAQANDSSGLRGQALGGQ